MPQPTSSAHFHPMPDHSASPATWTPPTKKANHQLASPRPSSLTAPRFLPPTDSTRCSRNTWPPNIPPPLEFADVVKYFPDNPLYEKLPSNYKLRLNYETASTCSYQKLRRGLSSTLTAQGPSPIFHKAGAIQPEAKRGRHPRAPTPLISASQLTRSMRPKET